MGTLCIYPFFLRDGLSSSSRSSAEESGGYRAGSGKNNSRLQQPVDPRGELLRRFDSQNSCRSKNEMGALRKPSPYKPSSYLLQKLREYEALYRKCGPHTFSYNRTAALLKAGPGWEATEPLECQYVVWSPRGGMGNRILSLASTFLYALLAGRVVLIDCGQGRGRAARGRNAGPRLRRRRGHLRHAHRRVLQARRPPQGVPASALLHVRPVRLLPHHGGAREEGSARGVFITPGRDGQGEVPRGRANLQSRDPPGVQTGRTPARGGAVPGDGEEPEPGCVHCNSARVPAPGVSPRGVRLL